MNLVQNGGVAIDLDSGLVFPVEVSGSGGGGAEQVSAEFYYCTAVSAEAGTWSGQKWEWSETGYVKSDEVTTGLAYGERFTPVAGESYNADATVQVSILYHKQGVVPEGAVFYASLSASRETAESGQALTVKEGPTPEEATVDGIPCLHFDSGRTILAFPKDGLPSGRAPFTVSCWAKMDAGSSAAHVFGYGNLAAEGGGCTVHLSENRVTDVGGCGYDHGCDLPPGKSATAWHHYAITWDATYSRIYVDGALVSKQDRAGRYMSLYNGAIGGSYQWGDYFSGHIAAARIYDSALDESGILSLAGEFSPVVA
jgi:hypothetical protein